MSGGGKRVLRMLILSQLGALVFVLKMALAGLPNLEPVTLLILVYSVTLGRWALIPIYLYVLLEYLVWGVHLWSLSYLYVWLVPWALALLFRRMASPLGWAVLAGACGLCFGALCAPVYAAVGGWPYALTWWAGGVPMDLLHCGGNFVMALVLFRPLKKLLDKLLIRARLKPPQPL
ncbi:MAG: hypothetical protein ACI4O5_06405 [Oscillospiraceae bacterium]